jgi:hypothetical protein
MAVRFVFVGRDAGQMKQDPPAKSEGRITGHLIGVPLPREREIEVVVTVEVLSGEVVRSD